MEKNMEFFTARPNLHQVFGRTVTKELEFDEWTEDKMVHQTLKDLVLRTEVENESEFNGIKSKEHSVLEQTLPEGTRIIWNEKVGYIIPDRQICTLEELEEDIKDMKNVYDDVYKGDDKDDLKRDEEKSS